MQSMTSSAKTAEITPVGPKKGGVGRDDFVKYVLKIDTDDGHLIPVPLDGDLLVVSLRFPLSRNQYLHQ